MKLPHGASLLDHPPALGNGRPPEAESGRRAQLPVTEIWVSAAAKSKNAGDGRARLAEPRSDRQNPRTASVAPANEVAVRLSVIDGGDNLVYTDVRDRKGWRQPLAVEQALQDVRSHEASRNSPTMSEPRIVRTVEPVEALPVRDSAPSASTTPYQAGKTKATTGRSVRAEGKLSAEKRTAMPKASTVQQAPPSSRRR